MTTYLHATLTAKPGRVTDLGDTVEWVSKGMAARGMHLLGAFRTTDDGPGGMVDLWRVPGADTVVDALADAGAHPSNDSVMKRLGTTLDDEVLRVLVADPVHDDLELAPGVGRRHAQVRLHVEYGRLVAVRDRRIQEAVGFAESTGWERLVAFEPAIAGLCEVYEFWRAPADADPATHDQVAAVLVGSAADVREATVTGLDLLPWSVRPRGVTAAR